MFNFKFSVIPLIALAGLCPANLRAQCQRAPELPKSQSRGQNLSPGQAQFYDEPKFTVAGVTDASNPAGHGSTVWRTSDALAKQTTSLGKSAESASDSASGSEKSLREAAKQPENFEANHRLGNFLLEGGKPAEALPYLERASRLKPADYENAYELALAYANVGNYRDSSARTSDLLARQDKPELHHLLAEDEEHLGNPLSAVHEFQRAAELDPSEPNLFDWGSELLLHHAPEPAAEVFASGNRRFPGSSRMLMGLGVSWYTRGSYDRAAACLCQASDLNPQDSAPYVFLGKMLSDELPPSADTLERLKRFATLQPDNATANYYYAVSLLQERKNSNDATTAISAESFLQKAVQLDPKLGSAYLQLGILHSQQNESKEAIFAYQKAVEADPSLTAAHYRLAQAYREIGDRPKEERELAIYKRLSKQQSDQAQRERHEMQQFVYSLRDATTTALPQ